MLIILSISSTRGEMASIHDLYCWKAHRFPLQSVSTMHSLRSDGKEKLRSFGWTRYLLTRQTARKGPVKYVSWATSTAELCMLRSGLGPKPTKVRQPYSCSKRLHKTSCHRSVFELCDNMPTLRHCLPC